jgi:hypothetical protein
MTGTRIGATGPIAELAREGTAVDYHVSSSGFMPFAQGVVYTHVTGTNSSSLKVFPGVNVVSGNTVHTLQMPLVASHVGALFTVRTTSAHAHILTGSLEAGGTTVFMSQPSFGAAIVGATLTLASSVGSAVALLSDGAHFLLVAGSGSIT